MQKTFVELVDASAYNITPYGGGESEFVVSYSEVLDLLKLVREATIEECTDILFSENYDYLYQIGNAFEELKLDRIKKI